MNAVIDRSGCIGCGVCANACPDVFRMAEDGLAEVYGEVSKDNASTVKDAEEGCPVSVITVE